MNGAHFHILINHFPIVCTVISTLMLLLAIVAKNEGLKRVAYSLFILAAILMLPTNYSGEQAEEIVEEINGIDHNVIEHHEEAAGFAFWTSIILGVLSLISFIVSIKKNNIKGVLSLLVFGCAILCTYFMWDTGLSGGKIRHPEILFKNEVQE